jgi:ParB family chromosome partitioning protein
MSHNGNKTPLGKGLAALLGDLDYAQNLSSKDAKFFEVNIHFIKPGKMQPRQTFDAEKMMNLVDSVKSKGILQPIVVRKINNDHYEIIAGERRWRAAKEAGLLSVPVTTIDCNDEEALEIGLIENLQRDDLNAMEEAESLLKLMNEFSKTQDEVAKAIQKSRSYVANLIRLNNLPEHIKDLIRKGNLSAGHARTLLSVDNPNDLAKQIIDEKLSVRQTEDLVREQNIKKSGMNAKGIKVEKAIDPDLLAVGDIIQTVLGLPTKIDITKNGGIIKLSFETYEQLDFLVSQIQTLKK